VEKRLDLLKKNAGIVQSLEYNQDKALQKLSE